MFSKPSLWLREWIYQEDEDTRGVATLIVLFIVITLYTWKIKISKKRIAPLPPGPRGLLLVGNLPFLEPDLNRYFADLAKIYGPIFKVQLVRRREGHQMVEVIKSMIGVPIAIHDYVNATLFDILTGMLWGGSLVVGEERKRITSEFRNEKDRKMKKLMLWFDGILDQVIDQRLAMKTEKDLDFLQVLLQCRDQVDQKSTPLKITHIKALLMVAFFALVLLYHSLKVKSL
ncbi:hypothetical protein IFM89_031708 [Coptis chinensis]|uniref:Cytochrome P450 n=1 Tax=Coptis chinensis TaxID=261450 RepID=A0A835MAI3_9MAGN|nr:hypothetical protein IFM89_031708 [Coptis chinensis]